MYNDKVASISLFKLAPTWNKHECLRNVLNTLIFLLLTALEKLHIFWISSLSLKAHDVNILIRQLRIFLLVLETCLVVLTLQSLVTHDHCCSYNITVIHLAKIVKYGFTSGHLFPCFCVCVSVSFKRFKNLVTYTCALKGWWWLQYNN